YDYKEGDLEGLVNYALSIKGVKLAALFSQRGGKVRISFRSIGDFPANELSRDNFEGGGHLNAAGGVSYLDLKSTIEKFENIIENYPQLRE
ncbi:MAG: DHHA1 domain-containing protein, partial [Bacteroidia bacterium]